MTKKSKEVRYALRRGVSIAGVKPDVIGETLTDIHARHGQVTAPVVVNEARPEEAPLHPCFEWRDEVAAEEFRLHQARSLIKCVQVIHEETKEARPVFVYVPPVESAAKGSYQPTEVVVQKPDLYSLALADLVSRMKSAQESVEQLRRAAEQSSDIDAERLARISMAVTALQTASAAVMALH